MQIKKERKQTYRYSYTQLVAIKPAKAPGQDSIGTGGQNSIGANSWEQNDDVNDFAQRDGLEALKLLLQSSSEPPKPELFLKKVSVGDVISNPSEKPAFAWKGYLPRGVVTLMSAHGGTGKSTIALMLAVSVALGRTLFGVDTQQCKVLRSSTVRRVSTLISLTFGLKRAPTTGSSAGFDLAV